MKKWARQIQSRLLAGQSGQALILVLVFLLLGSLILVPVLDQIGTALKTGVKYEDQTKELYAADAGIEDGIWRIKYGGLQALFGEASFEYIFSSGASYQLDDPVNGLTTNVTIENIWIPSNVTLGDLSLSADDAKDMIDSEKLVVSGTAGGAVGEPYRIKIDFVPDTGDNLTIKSVGVWLPQGFAYVEDSSTLEDDIFADYYPDSVTISEHSGGQAIVWNFDDDASYPLFTSFPSLVSDNGTLTSSIYFSYTPPPSAPTKLPNGIAWVVTEMTDSSGNPKTNDVPISWDVDTFIYKITSLSGDTKVEAYTTKLELRNMGDAASGDYVAVGNSLLTDADHDGYYRENLLSSSSATVSTIPSDGDTLSAYLYWSGWRNDATTIFSDTCADFTNWDRSTQERVPVSDNQTSGTWTTSPFWSKVDETTHDDSDYIVGVANGYQTFNFTPFTVPSDAAIQNLTVYLRARDDSTGNNEIRASIKVNGVTCNSTTSNNPGSSFTTYSYSFTTNPRTGAAWTVDDINGTGANPLQAFGVWGIDLDPDIRVSMVYAQANYSLWSIYNGDRFRGQGSSSATTVQRTITLKNSVDLSSYTPGMVSVFWNQTETGTLSSTDALYYAISADGGTTWSADYEVFHDDSPHSFGSFTVPSDYMTSSFKVRFYFTFDGSSEYLDLDNIKILSTPPDTSVTFSIAGQQVSLDGDGDPQLGGSLTGTSFSVLMNTSGYSYACKADVSKLVKTYPIVEGEQHHTGNAEYTVGDVTASTGSEIAYAGWSLVIIYFSPETAGHFLYLRDVFSYTSGGEDLDFDGDSMPGGDISGFVIPEPIKDKNDVIIETTAAKLTCFIGEGDKLYAGDYVALNAPDGLRSNPTDYTNYESYKLWDGITITSPTPANNASHPNNVFNSQSIGMSNDGVDIDTFTITWASGLLNPGDTSLHLDIYTNVDNWNIVFFILSVRSKTTIGGTDHYIIYSN
jgi:hypothetical protein